jgi:phosphoribosyl 1,2-cyclic phosphodiesterase
LKIKLWGTRGSIPTPSTTSFVTSVYGGDTTCLSIESDDLLVIIDGGSGLRLLGREMVGRNLTEATFFFTHVHWDHIQGFPFFQPAFIAGNTFNLYGPRLMPTPGFVGTILEKALRGQQQDLNFPVQLKDMPAHMNFNDIVEQDTVSLHGRSSRLVVTCSGLNHPGGCLGYRIEEHVHGRPVRTFTVATDTEHYSHNNPKLQKIAAHADILLYDGQYTDDEYNGIATFNRVGWGHSTWSHGLREAVEAGVKQLLLTHHDPLHDDAFIDKVEKEAAAAGKNAGVQVAFARQFQEFVL